MGTGAFCPHWQVSQVAQSTFTEEINVKKQKLKEGEIEQLG